MLPRGSLPFRFLDIPYGDGEIDGSLLFLGKLPTLAAFDGQDDLSASIFIVRSAANGRLFAIERVNGTLYALSRLASGVTLELLRCLKPPSTVSNEPDLPPSHANAVGAGLEWWQAPSITNSANLRQVDGSSTLAVPERRPSLSLDVGMKSTYRDTCQPSTTASNAEAPPDQNESFTKPDLENLQDIESVLENIRVQYQEALYASKASLAYFAKGPLSKARAFFQQPEAPSPDYSQIVAFIRPMILTLPLMDKKYRETVPTAIKELPFDLASDEDGASLLASMSKRRKKNSARIGKNGLYAGEEVNVARWWMRKDLSEVACDVPEAREDYVRNTLLEQRSRETQLQVILVLETLALESTASRTLNPNGAADEEESSAQAGDQMGGKVKKTQNLDKLLDLLIDRLSIWQSMVTEDPKTSKDENKMVQHRQSPAKPRPKTNQLNQFCVDVVIPFYGARLPEKSALICQKLGGPKDPSPKRPKLIKSASTNANSVRPGSSTSHSQPRRPRQTLERVLTDQKPGHNKQMPSLSRSTTEPSLPRLKRETSEALLSTIPLNRVQMPKGFSQREVDLHANSQAAEAKRSKKAKVDEELQSAIAALKKPNARMAVKELVDAAEERATTHRSKKSRHPRHLPAQAMQVMATPRRDRRGGSLAGLPRPAQAVTSDLENAPPSSTSRIPCSTAKVSASPLPASRASRTMVSKVQYDVEQTPTRGPSKFSNRPRSVPEAPASTSHFARPTLDAMVEQVERKAQVMDAQPSAMPTTLYMTPVKLDRQSRPLGTTGDPEHQVTATPVKATPEKEASLPPVSIGPVRALQEAEAREALCENDVDEVELL